MTTRRNNPPLPAVLPGRFFVLEYEPESECYYLTVDDDDRSSFRLGHDVQAVMDRMRGWGVYRIGCEGLDKAKAFGVVQVIPEENRVVLINPPNPTPAYVFDDEENGDD